MKKKLKKLIDHNEKILFLGLGNPMRRDDGVGVYISKNLNIGFNSLEGGKNPEKHINKVIETDPDLLIIIDSIKNETKPGNVVFAEGEEIEEKRISSHKMPISIFIDLLKKEIPDLNVFLIGIEPKDLSIGTEMSDEIKETANILINFLEELKSQNSIS